MPAFNSPRLVGQPLILWYLRCGRKQRHASQGAADAHRRSLQQRYPDVPATLRAYPCPICGGWHLGRSEERGHAGE
jgi:hypothetical protein